MSINIKDVVSLTGVSGLFQIVKSDDRAIIVESIDERQKRQMVRGNMMISKLLDISIYTKDESEPLLTILNNIQEKYGKDLPVTKKSSKDELMDFLEEVLPGYDKERVYASNVKKLIGWYEIISAYDIDLVVETEEEEEETEDKETQDGEA
jgi:hypothetical protein